MQSTQKDPPLSDGLFMMQLSCTLWIYISRMLSTNAMR